MIHLLAGSLPGWQQQPGLGTAKATHFWVFLMSDRSPTSVAFTAFSRPACSWIQRQAEGLKLVPLLVADLTWLHHSPGPRIIIIFFNILSDSHYHFIFQLNCLFVKQKEGETKLKRTLSTKPPHSQG